MERTIIFLAALVTFAIVLSVLEYSRREFNKKRREYRMSQALRRGLSQTEIQRGPRVIQWQS